MSFTCAYLRAGRDPDACDECEHDDCHLPPSLADAKSQKRDAMDEEIIRERRLAEVAGVSGANARQKRHYWNHHDEQLERIRGYRRVNPEKVAEWNRNTDKAKRLQSWRDYYARHKEARNEYSRQYHLEHRDEINAKRRERRRIKCRTEGASTAVTTAGCRGGGGTRGGAGASSHSGQGSSLEAGNAGASDGR